MTRTAVSIPAWALALVLLAGCSESSSSPEGDAGAGAAAGPDSGTDAGSDAAADAAAPPSVAAEAWPEADQLFSGDPRWIGGDAAYSVDLGSDRILWLFGDSFIATSPARLRSESVMVRNTVAVQTGRNPATASAVFSWREPTGPAQPESFFAEIQDTWLWPLHGVKHDGQLLLFFTRVRATGTGLGFEGVDWQARRVHNPDDLPANWVIDDAGAPPIAHSIFLGTTVLIVDDFLVAYGMQEPSHDLFAARWPLAEAMSGTLAGLEWYCGATGWDRSCAPERIIAGGPAEFTVHHEPTAGSYLFVETVGFGQADLAIRWAPQPLGPWSPEQTVFRPPEYDWPDALIYAGKAHAELTGADVVATYVCNNFDFGVLVSDFRYYFPRFVRLTFQPAR